MLPMRADAANPGSGGNTRFSCSTESNDELMSGLLPGVELQLHRAVSRARGRRLGFWNVRLAKVALEVAGRLHHAARDREVHERLARDRPLEPIVPDRLHHLEVGV